MPMKYLLKITTILCCAAAVAFLSCEDDIDLEDSQEQGTRGGAKEITYLLYMVGQNNLSAYLSQNIEWLMEGYKASNVDANVLVYADLNSSPELYLFEKDRNGNVQKTTVKTYPDQYSVDPEVMRSVLSEVFSKYPATRKGVTFSSHGSGSLYGSNTIKNRAFGTEGPWTYTMNVTDIRDALSGCPRLDMIMFDACLMASVETAYELKDCARYFLAAPNNVPATGVPYDKLLTNLLRMDAAGLSQAGKIYMDFYQTNLSEEDEWNDFASISLTDLSCMDTLAVYMDSLFQSPTVQACPEMLDRQRLQRMENGFTLYDFGEWVDSLGQDNPYVAKIHAVLDKAIVYEAHGEYASCSDYGGWLTIPIKEGAYCGLNTYVPAQYPMYLEGDQMTFFTTLRWYRDAGFWRSDFYNRFELQEEKK